MKTRFAPSPTGFLHAGNYRTAIFSYLVAKQHEGTFVLRIEDTDRVRSEKKYEDNIIESLTWLGISWEEFSRQSENTEVHKEALKKLVSNGNAYISKEPSPKDGALSEVIRFKNTGGKISFIDTIHGEISIDVSDLGDFVIAKSFNEPLFHLAVVVDDAISGITNVIRGQDHISNTPRQILIQRALDLPDVEYAHVPLILAPDRTKLSKRKGAKALTEYRDIGILPESMINYLALLGWHPKDESEFFSLDELVTTFSIERVQKGGAIFDETKLMSINQHWLRELSDIEYINKGNLHAPDTKRLPQIVPLLKERVHTFTEAQELIDNELDYLFNPVILLRDSILAKEPSNSTNTTLTYIEEMIDIISSFPEGIYPEDVKEAIMPYADEKGRGAVLWPLRYSLSGEKKSPDPFTLIAILGPTESIVRLKNACAILKE